MAAERAREPSNGAVPAQGPVEEDARAQPAAVADTDGDPEDPEKTRAVRRGASSSGGPVMFRPDPVVLSRRRGGVRPSSAALLAVLCAGLG